jgi:hypothetical protein
MEKMGRAFVALLAVLVCTVAGLSTASAQTALFSYNDNVGTPDAGTYTPGSSFTFAIDITFAPGGSVANMVGLSYWFEQQNPNAPFYFAITNRDLSSSIFSFPQTANAQLTYPQNMTPQNVKDLGGSTQDLMGVGAGTYLVANLTISISAAAAPGTYVIENTTTGGKTSAISDDQGHTAPIPLATYTITVVPEPTTFGLLAAGFSILSIFAFKRRSSNRA